MNRTRALGVLAVLLLSAAVAFPVSADDVVQLEPLASPAAIDNGVGTEDAISGWFVELSGAPTSEGGDAISLKGEKDSFRQDAAARGISFEERFSYDDLFNGLSVRATPDAIGKIRSLPGVQAIWPVVTESLPAASPVGGETIDLSTAIKMTNADVVQQQLGLTGRRVKVAVMDTGIDYQNPDLGGCFSGRLDRNDESDENDDNARPCRVFRGHDFVGDSFNADPTSPSYQPIPHPDPDPDDCNGHGTHVAGIIGANGAVRGVAPDVRFGAYRVFGCAGSTTSDIMLAAMERAARDKMDVLNMSIGAAFQWPQYPTAVGADRLVTKKGMVVVASIGNNGAMGLYSAGAPGVGAKVIGVASFDNTHLTLPFFTVTPDSTKVGFIQAAGSPLAPTSGTFTMARTGTTTTPNDACAALAPGSLAGKVALIRRGTCGFYQKAKNAENAGAVGVVLYNNVAGYVNATVAGTPAVGIPVVGTSNTFGALLDSRIAAGATTLSWSSALDKFPNPTAGLISGFSSYGLAPDLSLKPDIGAPGGFIYSTLPLEQGGHGVLSGTSMAAPHVAGAVALLLQSDKKIRPPEVRDILQNSATPIVWWGNPGLGLIDNVQRQGAGMVDILAAIQRGAVVTPGKLSLGESESGPATRTLTITNVNKQDTTYTFSHQPALATGPGTFTPTFFTGFASVAFSQPNVTVKKGKSATVNVTITANGSLADKSLYGGYIVVTANDAAGTEYRVPYAGFKGDYQSIQVLNPTVCGFPFVVRAGGNTSCPGGITLSGVTKQAPGAVFTLVGADRPTIAFHADHQSRRFSLDAVSSDGTAYRLLNADFFGRNSAATSFTALQWDGVDLAGTVVPDGTYTFRITILKALGDPANPAHTETATTPSFVIDRP